MGSQSLKVRFALLVAVAYLVLGAGSLLVFALVTTRIVHTLGTRFAERQALLERSKLLSVILQDLAVARQMARSPLLNRWAVDENNPVLRRLALEELNNYRQSFRGHSVFFACDRSRHYYFMDGVSKAADARPRYTLDPSSPNDDWYFRTIQSPDGYELNVNYDNQLQVTKVWFNVVTATDRKHRVGVCGSGLDITSFVNEILQSGEPGVDTILVSADGAIAGHRDRRFVLRNSRVRGAEKKITIYDLMAYSQDVAALKRVFDNLVSGKTQVATLYLTVQARRRLVAVAYLSEIKWHNLVLVDPSRVISFRDFSPILAATVLSLLAITLTVGALLHRLVLTPLAALAHSSRQIAGGKFDIVMPVHANDEVGQLTHSFNEMARMVKDYTENLEQMVSQRTRELDEANRDLAETHRQLMESIRAAEQIQTTLLPTSEAIERRMRVFYALYRPRDIVGGDFYCLRERGAQCALAVIDCVGHGVPGAFMAMTASALLDRALDTVGAASPALILAELDRLLRTSFQNRDHSASSPAVPSLDIGLCCFAAGDSHIRFSGARVDLYCVEKGIAKTVPGSKRPVGHIRETGYPKYEEHVVPVPRGGLFFLTTDGILDQPGGPRGVALGRRRFIALIEQISTLADETQGEALRNGLAAYQGERPQRDDITVVGFAPR